VRDGNAGEISPRSTFPFRSECVDLVGRRGEILRPAREQRGCRCDGVEPFAKKGDLPVLGNEIGHEQVVGESARRCGRGVNAVLGEHLVRGIDANDDIIEVYLELGVELEDSTDEALDACGALESAREAKGYEERHLEDAIIGEKRGRLLTILEVSEIFPK